NDLNTVELPKQELRTGTLQPARPYENSIHPSPKDPNEIQPPRNNAPKWQKWLLYGIGTSRAIYEIREQYKKHEQEVKNFIGELNNSNKEVNDSKSTQSKNTLQATSFSELHKQN